MAIRALHVQSADRRNTYVREEQILPHLATVAILLGGGRTTDNGSALALGVLGAVISRYYRVLDGVSRL